MRKILDHVAHKEDVIEWLENLSEMMADQLVEKVTAKVAEDRLIIDRAIEICKAQL